MPLHGRARFLAVTAALGLFALIFVLRLAAGGSAEADVGTLFVAPVALVALTTGRTGGLLAAILAVVLVAVWDRIVNVELGAVGYLSSGLSFGLLGVLLGFYVEELARARAVLEASEARLAEAQRMADVGSFEWDAERDEVVWSEELYRIFGLSLGNLQPSYEGFLERIHPGDRELVDGIVQRAMRDGRPWRYRARLVRPTGEIRLIDSHGQPIVEDGQVVGMRGTAQDVTERGQVEEAFREAEDRFAKGFDTAPIGMALLSTAPGEEGRFLEVNPALCELTGRSRTKLLASDLPSLVDSSTPEEPVGLGQLLTGKLDRCTTALSLRLHDHARPVGITGSLIETAEGAPPYALVQIEEARIGPPESESTRDSVGADPNGLLTDRDLEVLRLVAEGRSGREIADQLHLSSETIKSRLTLIYQKLGVRERAAAVAEAMRRGLLD